LSLPWLSRLSLGHWGYILTAVGLGGVLHLGSQHVNRFLFHRDRRDGVDRPVHALPFVALALLYVASISVLRLPATLLALPIAILGAALLTTGEEYYHAWVESARERPKRWPRRSVALLAVGLALLAVSGPLAFLAQHVPSGHSPMCGNSICQDRRFLARWMPRLEAWFHYRIRDVSTLKELVRRWKPEIAKGLKKDNKHEALADILDSIEELKYYRRTVMTI